ncbi:MarR family winged helix-turn-helix transcriptional regulator [Flagellimonas myxillae]|uniref:MarR family winged helix-turn-helix transcriptional regulator n=1 Tax=Flagellimonas myxillae TaxID=2942214 RepID=UPI00201EE590|nr:MarR family winged helix-turn-helix transcriptional regulator [Muricauda myxillae]MCL6268112.1 MarR family winged helix-turn-helix transcriptional regulator [Muricauda myxillae]
MDSKSTFDPHRQQHDLSSKIVIGLERVSQAFKVMLWNKAKEFGLSPIQIQILIFVAHHRSEFNNVSALAQEFNVTKPTISDAIRVLDKKALIIKDYSSEDNRSYTIVLSGLGSEVVKGTEHFAAGLSDYFDGVNPTDKEGFFKVLSELIHRLNREGVLTVQRTCFACKFYQKNPDHHYCHLLEKPLMHENIRLDCVEFVEKT